MTIDRYAIVPVLLLAGVGCLACGAKRPVTAADDAPPYAPRARPLVANISDGQLRVENRSGTRLYYQVVPAEVLQHLEWTPCGTPESCMADGVQSLDTGERVVVPLAPLAGPRTRELIVLWWRISRCDARPGWCAAEPQRTRVSMSARRGIG